MSGRPVSMCPPTVADDQGRTWRWVGNTWIDDLSRPTTGDLVVDAVGRDAIDTVRGGAPVLGSTGWISIRSTWGWIRWWPGPAALWRPDLQMWEIWHGGGVDRRPPWTAVHQIRASLASYRPHISAGVAADLRRAVIDLPDEDQALAALAGIRLPVARGVIQDDRIIVGEAQWWYHMDDDGAWSWSRSLDADDGAPASRLSVIRDVADALWPTMRRTDASSWAIFAVQTVEAGNADPSGTAGLGVPVERWIR